MEPIKPVLLEAVGVPDGHTLASYRARGGYAPLEQTLAGKQPGDVVEMVKASGLRGRGGAGFSTGLKWTFLPKDHPGPIYLCVNADESEPGTFNNRILMEDDPHQVIEGIILSSYATRASTAYIYLRYEYPQSWHRLQGAIDEAYAAVVEGRPPLHDGPWSMATLEVCLAILESARTGREVALRQQVAPRAVRLP